MKQILCMLLLLISTSNATNYYVSPVGSDRFSGTTPEEPLQHIQIAYQLAANGDTIILGPGVYGGSSNCISYSKPINIKSSSWDDPAVFACGSGTNCINLNSAPSSVQDIVFDSCSNAINTNANGLFTIDRIIINRSYGYGIFGGSYQTLNITRSIFKFSESRGVYGGSSGQLLVANSTFLGGDSNLIYCVGNTNAVLKDLLLVGPTQNSAISCYGASSCTVENIVAENAVGYGLYFYNTPKVSVLNAVVNQCAPSGMYFYGVSSALVTNSSIKNTFYGSGVAIYQNSGVTMLNVTITGNMGNTDSGLGGGIYIQSGFVSLQKSIISNNTAFDGGGFFCEQAATVTITDSLIQGNIAFYGGDYDCRPAAFCSRKFSNVTDVDNVSIISVSVCPVQ